MQAVRVGKMRRLLALGVGAVLLSAAVVPAQPEPGKKASDEPAKTEPVKTAEKTVKFEMRDKPWKDVIQWFSDASGLPFISNIMPVGTFNFISPKGGAQQQYTIPQIVDILNEALASQKLMIIRRTASFTIVAADEKIDPSWLPRLDPSDLDKRGNTEMAQIVIQLKTLNAEDVSPEVKKMMTPFGEVVALTKPNQLVMQDTVGNLKRIVLTLDKIEKNEDGGAEQFSYTCQYIKARDAEQILKDLMGDPLRILEAQQQRTSRDQQPQFGMGGGGPGGFNFADMMSGRGGRGSQQQQPALTSKVRMHHIKCDERTNTVFVTGPADKIAQAREILKKLDVKQDGQSKLVQGPAFLKTHALSTGNADAIAKTLQDIYKSAGSVKISAVGNNSIMVWGHPEDQIEIAKLIYGAPPEANTQTKVIILRVLEASKINDTLKGMLGDTKSGAPYIEADANRNALIVKGSREQVADVEAIIAALGEKGDLQTAGNMRIITLPQGSAATLADALERLLPQMRKNPVRVIGSSKESDSLPPLSPRETPKEPEKKTPPPAPKEAPPKDSKLKDARAPGEVPEWFVKAEPPALSDPQKDKEKSKGELPGKADKPLNIMAVGGKLILTCDDPEQLALANEVIRLLLTQGGEGDFKVLRLKWASASDAAKILDEAFNGVKPQAAQPQTGFGALFGGRGQQQAPAGPATPARIRVVADTATNSLLVRASPLDMLTVENLLAKIDTNDVDSKQVQKTQVVGPLKYASATEVASVLRDVYRESMNNNPSTSVLTTSPVGFAFARTRGGQGPQNVDANGNPRGVSLSIGVDDRSNSIICYCSDAMFADVKELVMELEEKARDSTRTIRVVSLKGVDPTLVQQAIDAIQGRNIANQRLGAVGGGSGFSPFGGGGQRSFGNTGNFGGGGFGNPGAGGFGTGGAGFGGGGGFGRPGGGGITRPPGRSENRGPDFFENRVMDDPQSTILFDPHQQQVADSQPAQHPESTDAHAAVTPVSFEEQQQPGPAAPPAQGPGIGEAVRGPRNPVNAQALEQLGVLIVSGNTPADVEEILRVIEIIRGIARDAEPKIRLVPLDYADATSVSNTLSQLFQQVIVGPTGNVLRSTGGTGQPAFAIGGGQGVGVAQGQQQQGASSVTLLPLPRFNAILMAAPSARVDDMITEIKRLDKPTSPNGQLVPFALKKASATQVATLLQNAYAQRYPNETSAQNQVRITYDQSTNTVFAQAAPADMAEIRDLIEWMDKNVSVAVNDMRIVPLRFALSDDMANLLIQAISQGVSSPTAAGAPGIIPNPGGGGGGGLAAAAAALRPGGAGGAGTTGGVQPVTGTPTQPGSSPKSVSVRFYSSFQPNVRGVESGLLEDIHVTSDNRTNTLILAAPTKTMDLLLSLVQALDVPPAAVAQIKIFTLKKADANSTAAILSQLFLGTTGGFTGAGATPTTGTTGTGGVGGGAGATGGFGGATGIPRPLTRIGDIGPEAAPLVDLRVSVDQRSNSVIVAGARGDLEVIEAIVSRMEDSEVPLRQSEVIKIKNAAAADVATAVQTFVTRSLQVLSAGGELPLIEEIERDVVIVPEPVSNTLLVSASPRYWPELMKLIAEIDAQPPQVVIQCLIAEVDLDGSEEFGVEIGLQTPILFQRGIIPDPSFLGPNGSVTYTTAATGASLVPGGVTATTINPSALPGFGFNSVAPLGNNPVVGPQIVGVQSLTNLGTNRFSANNNNIGGFIFSLSSDTFSFLLRALKIQHRLDIMSRPQIMTLDNQAATVLVGQSFPYSTGTNVTATGVIVNTVAYRNIGVELDVTPRISPDGRILMRVTPQISSAVAGTVSLGNGVNAQIFNVQEVNTTVLANDGETVVIGGLISKTDDRLENKAPWLGDLPYLGTLFRYRDRSTSKRELLVILTPHIVRSPCEGERVLADEAKRIDWVLSDVAKMHATTGMDAVLHPEGAGAPPGLPFPGPMPTAPGAPVPGYAPPVETAPQPRPVFGNPPVAPGQAPAAVAPVKGTQTANRPRPLVPVPAKSAAPLVAAPPVPVVAQPTMPQAAPPVPVLAQPTMPQPYAAQPETPQLVPTGAEAPTGNN